MHVQCNHLYVGHVSSEQSAATIYQPGNFWSAASVVKPLMSEKAQQPQPGEVAEVHLSSMALHPSLQVAVPGKPATCTGSNGSKSALGMQAADISAQVSNR